MALLTHAACHASDRGNERLKPWLQLYAPWNFHERTPGQFTFEGEADIERFLDIAQDLGLNVLLRVGPYICGEWDFGGFPWWLASSKVCLKCFLPAAPLRAMCAPHNDENLSLAVRSVLLGVCSGVIHRLLHVEGWHTTKLRRSDAMYV